jgi:predicted ester cyclase
MAVEQNKALFRKFVDRVSNHRDLSVIPELVANDFIEHEPLPPTIPTGIQGLEMYFSEWGKGFPNGKISVDLVVGEGDLIAGYQTWRGKHTGEYLGMPASGRSVEFHVVDIVRFENGKIVEHWAVSDTLTLLQQIGVVPVSEAEGL